MLEMLTLNEDVMADPAKPSFTKRALPAIVQPATTLAVVALSGLLIIAAVGFLNTRAAAVPEPEAASPLPVRVTSIEISDHYLLPRRFVGQIEPRASVDLSFELGGRIVVLTVDEGDSVTKGQVIARLDTDLLDADLMRLEASRAAAMAQLEFAEARLSRARKLQKQGFTSTERLDEALAVRDELLNRIAETDAALHAVHINKTKSTLYAPFTGRIGAQSVEANETILAGQPIVRVIESSAPEFRVGLPLDIAVDNLEAAQIDVAGRALPATLKQVRPDIDPVTRTRTAIFSLDTKTELLFGQTATLLMETPVEANGAWVPVDALQSGDGGVWTLLVVQDDRVRNAAVEILHIEGAKAFVKGSFDETSRIVATGAHRVVPGQSVTVIGAKG